MQEIDIKNSANHRGVPIIRDQSHQILVEYVSKYQPPSKIGAHAYAFASVVVIGVKSTNYSVWECVGRLD